MGPYSVLSTYFVPETLSMQLQKGLFSVHLGHLAIPIQCQVVDGMEGLTTTEQAFVPGHLSLLPLGPGQLVAFVPGPKASRASGGDRGLLSRLEIPTWTKGRPFVPVGGSTRDKRPNPFIPVGNTNPDKRVTLLSRLVTPTRTKG